MRNFCNYKSLVLILCHLSYRLIQAYDGFSCPPSNSETTAVKLRDSLLCNYDQALRPVSNHRNSTSIIFRLILKYFAYKTYESMLSLDAWLTVVWKDEHLTWNPADHEGIKYLHLHTSDIWTPDLSVYNMASQGSDPNLIGNVKCLVTSKGQVQGVIPIHLDILCVPDLTRYPFDTQNCTIRFGSWIHKGEELDLKFAKDILGTEELEPNGEWQLVSQSAVKNAGKYKCCPNETYPSIEISMNIKRLSSSHAASFVVPTLAGVILTFIFLSMSPVNKDRLTLCYVCFIGQFINSQFLSWQLPLHGEKIPLIITFSRDSLLLTVFAILFTVVFRTLMQKKVAPPTWISSIVSVVISCRPGQLILLSDYSTRGVASAKGEEDGATIVPTETNSTNQDWELFAKILDKLFLYTYIIVYLVMILSFLP
ncbi:nicotinic acetylcholine receptor alpha 9 subunit isoform X1 [Leptinotarsa decemlineata]|uniref:nicotinic acetylcholine receptor alpha 9 subunit isoform X1 n=1 Tax=Leptinotarsa decemlineata TaxID=7539 RepID=UPI003D30732B